MMLLMMILSHSKSCAQKDQRADYLMVSLINYYRGFDDISVNFTYREKLGNSALINSEIMGSLFMKDSLFVVSIPGLEMRSNGMDIYTITSENQEVYRSSISESEQIPFHLLNLLSYLQNHFEARSDITENRLDRKIVYIKLTPLHPIDSMETVLLGIDDTTNELSSLIIENSDNIDISMSFDEHAYNQGLDADFFVFNLDDYPDYTIIE